MSHSHAPSSQALAWAVAVLVGATSCQGAPPNLPPGGPEGVAAEEAGDDNKKLQATSTTIDVYPPKELWGGPDGKMVETYDGEIMWVPKPRLEGDPRPGTGPIDYGPCNSALFPQVRYHGDCPDGSSQQSFSGTPLVPAPTTAPTPTPRPASVLGTTPPLKTQGTGVFWLNINGKYVSPNGDGRNERLIIDVVATPDIGPWELSVDGQGVITSGLSGTVLGYDKWDGLIDKRALGEGSYTLRLRSLRNKSADVLQPFIVDVTPPSISELTDEVVDEGGIVKYGARVIDPESAKVSSGVKVDSIRVEVIGETLRARSKSYSGGNSKFYQTITYVDYIDTMRIVDSAREDGDAGFTVVAQDNAGNESKVQPEPPTEDALVSFENNLSYKLSSTSAASVFFPLLKQLPIVAWPHWRATHVSVQNANSQWVLEFPAPASLQPLTVNWDGRQKSDRRFPLPDGNYHVRRRLPNYEIIDEKVIFINNNRKIETFNGHRPVDVQKHVHVVTEDHDWNRIFPSIIFPAASTGDISSWYNNLVGPLLYLTVINLKEVVQDLAIHKAPPREQYWKYIHKQKDRLGFPIKVEVRTNRRIDGDKLVESIGTAFVVRLK